MPQYSQIFPFFKNLKILLPKIGLTGFRNFMLSVTSLFILPKNTFLVYHFKKTQTFLCLFYAFLTISLLLFRNSFPACSIFTIFSFILFTKGVWFNLAYLFCKVVYIVLFKCRFNSFFQCFTLKIMIAFEILYLKSLVKVSLDKSFIVSMLDSTCLAVNGFYCSQWQVVEIWSSFSTNHRTLKVFWTASNEKVYANCFCKLVYYIFTEIN